MAAGRCRGQVRTQSILELFGQQIKNECFRSSSDGWLQGNVTIASTKDYKYHYRNSTVGSFQETKEKHCRDTRT